MVCNIKWLNKNPPHKSRNLVPQLAPQQVPQPIPQPVIKALLLKIWLLNSRCLESSMKKKSRWKVLTKKKRCLSLISARSSNLIKVREQKVWRKIKLNYNPIKKLRKRSLKRKKNRKCLLKRNYLERSQMFPASHLPQVLTTNLLLNW